MKKLLLIYTLFFLSLLCFSQERELSDYEKYRLEQEQEMLAVKYDTGIYDAGATIPDTIEQQTEVVVINNYYIEDNQPDYRYMLTFGHRPYRSYYDPYYDPYYYNNWYGYNPYYYGGWGYSSYYNVGYGGHYYSHNYYNSRPRGQLYAKSNSLGWSRNHYQPYNKTYKNGYVNRPTSTKKSPYNMYTKTTATTRPTANINRNGKPVTRVNKNQQTYTPRYSKPRSTTRASYNNSKARSTKATVTRPQYNRPTSTSRVRSSSTYNRPSTTTKSSSSYNRSQSTTPSRSTYSRPASSRSSYSRPSSSSSSGRSYSSGSASRSSGSRSSGKK